MYIFFSDQESQNFLFHCISLRLICLQISIELLWYSKIQTYDFKNLPEKLLHAILAVAPSFKDSFDKMLTKDSI